MTDIDIEKVFTYQSPNSDQIYKYAKIREKAKELANLLNEMCPHSREKALAFTKLRECIMWANASIALNEEKPL